MIASHIRHPPPRSSGGSCNQLSNFCFFNINSLCATEAGGLTGSFLKKVQAISFLSLSNDVIHLMDTRCPADLYKELRPLFPRWGLYSSPSDDVAGGVITLVSPKVMGNYQVSTTAVIGGYVQAVDFTHANPNHNFRHICSYLHSNDDSRWKLQAAAVAKLPYRSNTFFFGDLNYLSLDEDMAVPHSRTANTRSRIFHDLLNNHGLQELEQSTHTRYGFNKHQKFTSSKLDRVFHNLDFSKLALTHPRANVVTEAPWTITAGQPKAEASSNRAISSCTPVKDGGTQISDHLPVTVRFISPFATKRRTTIPNKHLDSRLFLHTFNDFWDNLNNYNGSWKQLKTIKRAIFKTSKSLDDTPTGPTPRHTRLSAAVRLLKAIEDGISPSVYCKRFEAHPDLLELTADGTYTPLLNHINLEFATMAYEDDRKPRSRIAILKSVLPLYKKRITTIYDPLEGIYTDDKKVLTDTAYDFWKDKWSKKNVKASSRLLKKYGKRVTTPPSRLTIAKIQSAIAETNDSAPGPDGIPFKAYKIISDVVAPVLYGCIRLLMKGGSPPDDFNGGLLYLLPKKDTALIEDTRPLVVNNTDNRIIASVVHNLIYPSICSILSPNQHGFKHDSSVDANICYFNERFYSSLERRRNYDVAFVDISKAFDSVAHSFLLDLVSSIGLGDQIYNIVSALFDNAYCMTTFLPDYFHKIYFESGVKQGCPLSPLLFLLVMDVLDWLLTTYTGCEIRLYADDTAIGSINLAVKLPTISIIFKIFADTTGLQINISKSVCISTYHHAGLRAALDAVGWTDVKVVGKAPYLGIHMGHLVTLDDIFAPVREKFMSRLRDFTAVKYDISLSKRVTVWNTWLLPVFSFVSKFYRIPTDYQSELDRERDYWIDPSKRFTVRHLTRPSHLVGLACPIRDTYHHNTALLVSNASLPHFHTDGRPWSIRIRSHRQDAVDALSSPAWRLSFPPGTRSNYIYKILNSHTNTTNPIGAALRVKLARMDITHHHYTNYLATYKALPSWVPNYARATNIAISHNALRTAHRNNFSRGDRTLPCPLCKLGKDAGHHLFGACPIAWKAAKMLNSTLGLPAPHIASGSEARAKRVNLCFFIGATPNLPPTHIGIRFLLSHSIWQARCNAQNGDTRPCWARWIIDDTIKRCARLCPTIFCDSNFPDNTISVIHKVQYRVSLGASGKRSRATADLGKAVIANALAALPPSAHYAFTDGSALGNPGPAGSGFALYQKCAAPASLTVSSRPPSPPNSTDTLIHTDYAALGLADNQIAEIFAIGMVVDHCSSLDTPTNLHIWTDSRTSYGIIAKNWRSRNRALSELLRDSILNFRSRPLNSLTIHWCPGHAGVPQNDLADTLANAGSRESADSYPHNMNIVDSVRTIGFTS